MNKYQIIFVDNFNSEVLDTATIRADYVTHTETDIEFCEINEAGYDETVASFGRQYVVGWRKIDNMED